MGDVPVVSARGRGTWNIAYVAGELGVDGGGQGVLSLARKHGVAVVDEVCAQALALDLPTYRFVRQAIEHRRDDGRLETPRNELALQLEATVLAACEQVHRSAATSSFGVRGLEIRLA